MAYVKWVFIAVFWLLVAAFLHYTLPQTDIVRIVNTYEESHTIRGWKTAFWAAPEDSTVEVDQRYVQFIQTVDPDGDVMVYRNEDTGWGWPPYFKFTTSNLYTEAADLVSTKETPKWVALKHYGWRNEVWTVYPNALSVHEVSDPNTRIIPWLNIIILTTLFAAFWAIRVRVLRVWNRLRGD
ncbi:MAG: DUF1523 family protein [Pelagimonas sp.]|jgi:hypothetical protein|nr:DUF1523 family protein [Pelagimonas sp.]